MWIKWHTKLTNEANKAAWTIQMTSEKKTAFKATKNITIGKQLEIAIYKQMKTTGNGQQILKLIKTAFRMNWKQHKEARKLKTVFKKTENNWR